MSEEPKDDVQEIVNVVDSAISRVVQKIPCEHCGKETSVLVKAIFRENKFTMVLSVDDGHFLQAETIGGVLINLAKMFKARARDMGVKIEVLIPNIRFGKNKITINALSVLVGAPTSSTTDRG